MDALASPAPTAAPPNSNRSAPAPPSLPARALIAAGTPTSLATIGRTGMTAGTVAAAAAAGDEVARSIFTTAAATLGIQLANLTRLVDPETVALGGGVTLAGDIF